MTIVNPSHAERPASRRLRIARPRADTLVVRALYVGFVIFYLANVYHRGLSAMISLAKWPVLAVFAAVAITALVRRHGQQRTTTYFVPFILVLMLSLSCIESSEQLDSLANLVSVAALFISTRLIAANFDHIALRKRFFDVVLVIGVLVVLSLMIMYPLGINLGRTMLGRFTAWSDNPNTLGMMLAPATVVMMAGALARRPQWKWRYGVLLLPSIFFINQTGSRASMLWLAGSAVAFWIYRKGVSLGALFTGLFLVLFFGWRDTILQWLFSTFTRNKTLASDFDTATSGRSEVWELGMSLAKDHPLLGYGLGSSGRLIEEYDWYFVRHQGGHFHNSYLSALVETGVVGLAALLVVIAITFAKALREARQLRALPQSEWPFVALPFAMFVGALCHAVFESWLLSAGNADAPLFWCCVWMMHEGASMTRRPGPPLGYKAPPRATLR